MRTRMTILAIVGAAAVGMAAAVVGLALLFGWLVALGAVAVVLVCYQFLLRQRMARWGATDEEVDRAMPGDELLENAGSITRAITIAARPELIWPWLVQIGFGRLAGTATTGSTTTDAPVPTGSSRSSRTCASAIGC